MGSSSQTQIPAIEFVMDSQQVNRGSDEWYLLCNKVREACESYGCFEIVYKIDPQLKAETLSASRELFSLPLERKKKNTSAKPFQGYIAPNGRGLLYEGFGFEEASDFQTLKTFTEGIWSHDQLSTVLSMMKQLIELKDMIILMILDSYGVEESSNSIMASETLIRLQKYTASPSGEYTVGAPAHTDKHFGTILCDDLVSGLEVETKDGQWVKLPIPPRSYVFVVGDSLMAWSSGRMHSVNHRVMCAEEDRHSLATFVLPVEDSVIKAQKELVDEDYPKVLKDFTYKDLGKFLYSEGIAIESKKQIFAFAGIGNEDS